MGIDWNNVRLETPGGIPYKLLGGPTFGANENGATAGERYLIRASDVESFLAESIPPASVLGGLVFKPARRRLPGSTSFFTRDVKFSPHSGEKPGDPLGADPGAPEGTYDTDYIAEIEYELTLAEDDDVDPNDPETFLEHSVQSAGEFLNIPTAKLDGKDSDVNGSGSGEQKPVQSPADVISKVVCNLEHTLSWKFALNPDWRKIIRALGTTNSQAMSIFFDAPVDTTLFVGVGGRQEFVWTGAGTKIKPWALDYKFLHKEIEDDGKIYSWQHAWVSIEQGWKKILRQPGDRPLYESSDFADLFKPTG